MKKKKKIDKAKAINDLSEDGQTVETEDVTEADEGKKKPKRKRRFPIWARVICIILAVFLVLVGSAAIFISSKLSKIQKYDPQKVETVPPEEEYFESDKYSEGVEVIKPDDVIWSEDVNTLSKEGIINILLIGQDTRDEGDRGRSDSMMILTIDKTTKHLKVTSLMRDMYVQIPGYSDNKINAAYAFGGYELLKATIEKNFGITVDYFAEVDFFAFKKVVDIVGGVYIDLTGEEAYALKGLGHRTVEGRNRLDGDAALAYCRMRYVGNSDYDRTARQRKTLDAIYSRLRETATIPVILDFIDEIFPLITTDMTNGQIVTMAMDIYGLNISNVEQYRVPVDGAFSEAYVNGMAVLLPDLQKNREYLWEIIYGE